jgi:hypothetical protein
MAWNVILLHMRTAALYNILVTAQNTELYESWKSNYSATDHFSDFKYMSEYDTTVDLTIAITFHKMLDMYIREIEH